MALLARGSTGLEEARRDVERLGGTPLVVPTDVAEHAQVVDAAARVEEVLGDIDVWVNVAFTSVFARFVDIEPEEFRRVTEVNYLGYVYGTLVALRPDAASRPRRDRPGRLGPRLPRHPAPDAPTAARSTPCRASTSRCAPSCSTTRATCTSPWCRCRP